MLLLYPFSPWLTTKRAYWRSSVYWRLNKKLALIFEYLCKCYILKVGVVLMRVKTENLSPIINCYPVGWQLTSLRTCHPIGDEKHLCTCWPPCCAVAELPPTWLTCQWRSTGTGGLPKKQVKDPPDQRARGRICVLVPERRGVELQAACGPFNAGTLLAVSAHGCHSLQTTFQNSVPNPDLRIHMFLGFPDPDPLVRGMDPDPDPHIFGPPGSGFFYHQAKLVRKKNLNSFCFVTSLGLFIFVKWCKCTFKK